MDKQRRSFEFRMSKKVAELTQVVHMLFTRNHEKEVEIEALKEAYELEIQNVILDAKKRISSLQSELEVIRDKEQEEREKIKQLLEQEYVSREAGLQQRLAETERLLSDERNECQNIRDLLINAQKDIEQLRNGVADQLHLKSDEITKRDKEIDRLRKQVAFLEKAMKDSEKETSSAVRDFEKSNDKLEKELTQMHEVLTESQEVKEQLTGRIKTLEGELKALKKDFNRRVADHVASHVNKMPRSAPAFTNHNEELERLRREIQRYRLELSNRDSNFNRVFSSQQPMIVDNKAVKVSSPQPMKSPSRMSHTSSNGSTYNPGMHNGIGQQVLVNGFLKSMPRTTMPSTPSAVPKTPRNLRRANLSSTLHTYYEELQPSPRPNSAASSQLPSISSTSSSADARSRSQRFSKPRPLPREMLSTK